MPDAPFACATISEPYIRPSVLSDSERKEVLGSLLRYFLNEKGEDLDLPHSETEQKKALRALLNIRPPKVLSEEIQKDLDGFLWTERVNAGIISASELPGICETLNSKVRHYNVISLWKGDITRIDSDAIVNAANQQLLGCFSPLHSCIDNAIHSAAGIQLRFDCSQLMQQQKHPEQTGKVKITRAYNLPSRFVLHTVGPVVSGHLNEQHRNQLASCYTSCLNLAAQHESIKTRNNFV